MESTADVLELFHGESHPPLAQSHTPDDVLQLFDTEEPCRHHPSKAVALPAVRISRDWRFAVCVGGISCDLRVRFEDSTIQLSTVAHTVAPWLLAAWIRTAAFYRAAQCS